MANLFEESPVQIDHEFEEHPQLKWWGAGTWEISVGESTIAIDPYLNPSTGIDYALVTHEHYDHCHEPTLRTLRENGLEELVVARSCMFESEHWYASRDLPLSGDLDPTVLFPRYYQKTIIGSEKNDTPKWQEPDLGGQPPSEIDLGPFQITAVEAPGEEPAISAPYEITGPYANLGYLIEDTVNDFTIYAMGDLRIPYPEMIEYQNEADLVLYPLGKPFSRDDDPLEYQIWSDIFVLGLFQPNYIVPHHYLHDGDYPLPQKYDEDDPIEYWAHIGHWFPSIDDPEAYVDALRAAIDESPRVDAEVLPLRAGETYELS